MSDRGKKRTGFSDMFLTRDLADDRVELFASQTLNPAAIGRGLILFSKKRGEPAICVVSFYFSFAVRNSR